MAVAFGLLAALLVALATANEGKRGVNHREAYCSGKEFVGNDEKTYPHLHCTEGGVVFNIKPQGGGRDIPVDCMVVDRVLRNPERIYGMAASPEDITDVFEKFKKSEECHTYFNKLHREL